MPGKITRIFIKSLSFAVLGVLLLAFCLMLCLQSYRVQTWLAKRVSIYLSEELHARVEIKSLKIDFFSRVMVNGLKVMDLHRDTLFYGDLHVSIKQFNLKHRIIELKNTEISKAVVQLLKYPGESSYNFNFLLDYFNSSDTASKEQIPWHFDPGSVNLQNIKFEYARRDNKIPDEKHIDWNHIFVQLSQGTVSAIRFENDSLSARLNGIKLRERSGFDLHGLNAEVTVHKNLLRVNNLYLQTPGSLLLGELAFRHKDWSDYENFIEQVNLKVMLRDSTLVNSNDIAFFTSELDGLNREISVSGDFRGTVNDLRARNLNLRFGRHCNFRGTASIQGLPDISSSFLHFDARQFSLHYNDLATVPAYPFSTGKKIPWPIVLKKFGRIAYKGKFDGFMNDFTTYGSFKTEIGNMDCSLSLFLNPKTNKLNYKGSLVTSDLDLGRLMELDELGQVDVKGELEGEGSTIQDLATSFNLRISSIQINTYNYQNIAINGHIEDQVFNGMLNSLDSNLNLDFNGSIDFNKKVPDLQFISTINRMDLAALKFLNLRDSGIISAQLFIDTKGNSIDDLSGLVHLDNLVYTVRGKSYKLASLNLELNQENSLKKILLKSAYLNAGLSGRFKLSKLNQVFKGYLYNYYPTFFKKPQKTENHDDSLKVDLTIKNFNTLHDLFLKDYFLSKGSNFELNFLASANKLSGSAHMPMFQYKNFNFKAANLKLNEEGKDLKALLTCNSVEMNDSNLIDRLELDLKSGDNNLGYRFHWNNIDSLPNFGTLKGSMSFADSVFVLNCDSIEIQSPGSEWKLNASNSISVFRNGDLLVQPLLLSNKKQSISLEGNYTRLSQDSLSLKAVDVDMSTFNPVLGMFGLKFNGILNSNMIFSKPNDLLIFRGFSEILHFKLNDNSLGEVVLNTAYDNNQNFIHLDGYTALGLGEFMGTGQYDLSFKGNYFLDRKEESLDIDFVAHAANLRILNPLLQGFLTVSNGFVKGDGKIHGTPSQIKIDSKLNLFHSDVKLDYTGVHYFVTGEIEIMPDQIRFSDLLLRDRTINSQVKGVLNGNIFHDNFEKIRIDYDVNYDKMLVLNTTELDNPYYYGRVYGSGNVGIYGYLDNLNLEIKTTVEKNTRFILPLDGPAELNDEDFIHFVVRDTIQPFREKTLSGLNLDMNLKITPDAEMSIIMDRKTGDILNVQGEGDLDLNINTLGKFDMKGDYVITDGTYQFTLKTLINKKFEIDGGSHITWSGDPLDAEIDVVARYRQRASVAPLLNDTTGQYGSRQPVDCKLLIAGKLANPDIHFDIDVPNIEPTAMARIENVLSDEAEMNRQVFSFLLFRNFVTPQIYTSQGGGVSAGSAAASTGSEMLSNRASEFLNSYFGNLTGITDMQLGVNYRPATGSNGEEFDVALSKQFLNNRINVDGNFGVNSNPNNSSTGLIGDVTVEYKLSEDGRYRLKAFNQTNDNTQVTILGGPYTQGIGLFYREEFNTFRELLDYYKRKLGKSE